LPSGLSRLKSDAKLYHLTKNKSSQTLKVVLTLPRRQITVGIKRA